MACWIPRPRSFGEAVQLDLPRSAVGVNEYIYALTFISSAENKTVPVGVLTELISFDVYNWGGLMAGAMLGSLPVAILYSFFVEHYVSSMTGADSPPLVRLGNETFES